MENKNTLIALMLMMAVWFGYIMFFPPAPAPEDPAQQTPEAAVSDNQSTAPETAVSNLPPETKPSSSAIPESGLAGVDATVPTVTFENELYTAVFSTSGARLVSLQLKNFHEEADPQSPLVSLVDPTASSSGTLSVSGSDGMSFAENALFRYDGTDSVVHAQGAEVQKLVFTFSRPDGVTIEKIYQFSGNKYPIDLTVKLTNGSGNAISGNLSLALVQPWNEDEHGDRFNFVGPVTFVGEDLKEDAPKDLLEQKRVYDKDIIWSGFENKYFLHAVVPLKEANYQVQIDHVNAFVRNLFATAYTSLPVGQSLQYQYLLYFGPRDLDILEPVNYHLDKAIDFGFFTPIATPLLHVLKFFYAYIGNYGVAIIILTVIIKILFWPLTHKSYASMKAMQKLQPEMQKIREKFKNDRERQSREMMTLYKTHRVNPMGGCLPMFIQIPVFFALYKVLMGAIELRQAPFAFWLTDLSLKDPYYITPVIMGVTMFIQQKLTPSTMDPTQAKVFLMMPVIFTFLFLNFPSGLVIYWLVNNLLTILQQYFIYKRA